MSLNVLKAAADAENADGLHLARLLVLLRSADKANKTKPKPVEGITKLAKLDFLLRYPIYLERALIQLGKSPDAAAVTPRERTTVETKMIRFRYGPWDGRYRRWLSLLSARGLITLSMTGRKIYRHRTRSGGRSWCPADIPRSRRTRRRGRQGGRIDAGDQAQGFRVRDRARDHRHEMG